MIRENKNKIIAFIALVILLTLIVSTGFIIIRKNNPADKSSVEAEKGKVNGRLIESEEYQSQDKILGESEIKKGNPNHTLSNLTGSAIKGTDQISGILTGPTTSSVNKNPITIEDYKVLITFVPQKVMEGGVATFNWQILGERNTVQNTAVYFGPTREGDLSSYIFPQQTKYTQSVKDFQNGTFDIPLNFVGNSVVSGSGTFFARAHAFINGKNYWSQEAVFYVEPAPKYGIRIVDFPQKVILGENASFTWEVLGPQNQTSFSVIVESEISKEGDLGEEVSLSNTPYSVLVKEFTTDIYIVPLRFVGNAYMNKAGTRYFRALAFIDGKNIWSEEHSLKVE